MSRHTPSQLEQKRGNVAHLAQLSKFGAVDLVGCRAFASSKVGEGLEDCLKLGLHGLHEADGAEHDPGNIPRGYSLRFECGRR